LIVRLVPALLLSIAAARCLATESPPARATTMPIQILRERIVRSVIPITVDQIRGLDYSAHDWAKKLNPDGTWPGIDYNDTARTRWSPGQHLERILLMSKAYRAARDANKSDPALKEKIDLALSHWLDHDYKNPNWWWNEIGVPQFVGETLLLLSPEVPRAQLNKGLEILRRADWSKWTGQNLVWGVSIQIVRGILEENVETISAGYSRMYQEVRITTEEGIQPDYSFHQHGAQLYNGAYGLAFANDVGRFVAFSWDTPWQIPPDKLDTFTNYMVDAQAWMIWDRIFDYSAVGREIVRKGKAAIPRSWAGGPVSPVGAAYSLLNTVHLLSEYPLPRVDEWQALESRLRLEPRATPLFGNKHFWCSDYMAHRRLSWFVSIKMLSDRMYNAELVNDEGRKSHHLSEGATLIYRSGDEYRDIFPVWDWRKIPGTTAEQFPLTPDANEIHFKGATSFVGGVSDGTYGLAFMDLKRGPLTGHKAWFCFDDEIVALGAGIGCTSDKPVITTVNQCALRGQVNQGFNPARRWIHQDGTGYIFPQRPDPADKNPAVAPPNITVIARPQTGSWSDLAPGPSDPVNLRVFTVAIDHGTHPQNAAYAYMILPDTAADEVARRSQRLDLDILSNKPDLQSVYHRGLDILMAVFFKPGTLGNLTVDQPCLLILRNGKLTLANPENKALAIGVTIGNMTRKITLPAGPVAGSSVTIDTAQP
jgi:chondroitin AC lyase